MAQENQVSTTMTTPARRQYLRIKGEHQDAILLFRMGDFYETFDEDARTISRELEIALTSREMGKQQRVALAGIPYHALDTYLAKLIRKGYKVAICEQTSDPATSRGLVERQVVQVVTPGTVIETSALEQNANNYLASVVVEGQNAGFAYVDITTNEFVTTQLTDSQLAVELARVSPAEILIPDGHDQPPVWQNATISPVDEDAFQLEWARETLTKHFKTTSLEAYGCEKLPLAIRAAGAIVDYLCSTQKQALAQLTSLHTYSTDTYMVLDAQTRRNLELFKGGRWSETNSSLCAVLDRTRTSMGGRLLRRWIGQPLLEVPELVNRQQSVAWFYRSALRRGRVITLLEEVSDLERLVNRVARNVASPRDVLALARSLETGPQLKGVLSEDDDTEQVVWLLEGIPDSRDVIDSIVLSIADDPPPTVSDGGVIREGFSSDLDAIRVSAREAREYIARLERKERETTGIKSLKVGFNKVFGYYIEVSKPNLDKVPDEYIRRQTLVGGERFITPEMKEYESLILSAQHRIYELEAKLFRQLCEQISMSAESIMQTARTFAKIDVLCSLGEVAERFNYVRPEISDGPSIEISGGRHPVVEKTLPTGSFVPNDIHLSNADEQLIVLTGPNMSGKSTFIRQIALITLMAQIGSFVPAESAKIGLVDRIFTRIGLQDDLAVGQSTFMVEMVETAYILNHATPRSLVILDEIGRGTSTYDGLAIARAVAEHIHNHSHLGCKTLFATHYHELTKLANSLSRARNYNVAVSEEKGEVVFLRRIVPGGADRSYGVQVARLAGLPNTIVNRASKVLIELEDGGQEQNQSVHPNDEPCPEQLPLIPATTAALEDLLALDISSITPLEAITELYELQEKARKPNNGDRTT